MEIPPRPGDLDPIMGKIIEALARTMVNHDHSKQRRLVEFREAAAMANSERPRLMS